MEPCPKAGIELTAGEVMFNRDMFYTATLGEILYNEWMGSFVAASSGEIFFNEWVQSFVATKSDMATKLVDFNWFNHLSIGISCNQMFCLTPLVSASS